MSNWSNEEQRQSWQTHLVALKNRIANLEDGRPDQSGAAGFLAVSKSSGIAVRLSVRSILGQLLHDGGEIEPDVLALDVAAVRKLHDVKQPEFEGAIASLEGCPPNRAVWKPRPNVPSRSAPAGKAEKISILRVWDAIFQVNPQNRP